MLGVNFAGGNRAAVSDTEGLSLPVTGQRDLAADHHDARIPIMGVVGVHHCGLEPTLEDLVALASQIGFEFSLVHDKPSCEQVRTKRLGRPPHLTGTRAHQRERKPASHTRAEKPGAELGEAALMVRT